MQLLGLQTVSFRANDVRGGSSDGEENIEIDITRS